MKKAVAILLLLTEILLLVTLTANAEESPLSTGAPERLSEIEELRECNSEAYLLSDGTYESVVYAEDKYFEDENGKLSEIDNTIEYARHIYEGREYSFTNKANSTKFLFSEREASVLINAENCSVSFSAKGNRSVETSIGDYSGENAVDVPSLSGKNHISFLNAFENADLVCEVQNHSLNVFIVLKNALAPSEYTFSFNSGEYRAAMTEFGGVGFFDSNGEMAFCLGSLSAVDSGGSYTEGLNYSLSDNENGQTDVTVSIPEAFLSSPDRSYPTYITLSVTITGSSKTQDSFVSSKNPSTNYYTNTYLRMGYSSSFYVCRTYIRLTCLPTFPGALLPKHISKRKNMIMGTALL